MAEIATIDCMCSCHGGSNTRIITGATKMYVNGKPVARIGDRVTGNQDHGEHTITQGYNKLIVEGQPVAYVGAQINCGGHIVTGHDKVNFKGV